MPLSRLRERVGERVSARRDFPVTLESPPHALKFRKRGNDRVSRNADFQTDRDRSERIQYVVQARQVKRDFQFHRHAVVAANRGEPHAAAFMADVDRANLRILRQAVSGDRLADARQYLAHVGIVHAQDGAAIERQTLQEVHERLLEAAEIVVVGFHVVCVDIGDHRQDGREVQERSIGFVRLGHDVFAGSQPGVGRRCC